MHKQGKIYFLTLFFFKKLCLLGEELFSSILVHPFIH
jgi:hypothetical protein